MPGAGAPASSGSATSAPSTASSQPQTSTGWPNERSAAITSALARSYAGWSDGRNTAWGHFRYARASGMPGMHPEGPCLVRRGGHHLTRSARDRRRHRRPPAVRGAPVADGPPPPPGTRPRRRAGSTVRDRSARCSDCRTRDELVVGPLGLLRRSTSTEPMSRQTYTEHTAGPRRPVRGDRRGRARRGAVRAEPGRSHHPTTARRDPVRRAGAGSATRGGTDPPAVRDQPCAAAGGPADPGQPGTGRAPSAPRHPRHRALGRGGRPALRAPSPARTARDRDDLPARPGPPRRSVRRRPPAPGRDASSRPMPGTTWPRTTPTGPSTAPSSRWPATDNWISRSSRSCCGCSVRWRRICAGRPLALGTTAGIERHERLLLALETDDRCRIARRARRPRRPSVPRPGADGAVSSPSEAS